MLIGFSVSNFKSFNDNQTISFLSTKIARHKEHIFQIEDKKILKSGLIFGANASGKSNLIKAIAFSRKLILLGIDKVDLTKKNFRISTDSYKNPAVFEYRLMIDDTEYSYGVVVSYCKKEVLAEWLVKIKSDGSEEMIFNREVDKNDRSNVSSDKVYDTQEENKRIEVYLEDFSENISDAFRKKTILSDIAERVNDQQNFFIEIRKVYEWFKNMTIIFPSSKYNGINDIISNDKKKNFFTTLLSYFDTGIQGVEGREKIFDFDKILNSVPEEVAEKVKVDISNKVEKHPIMMKVGEQIVLLKKDKNGDIKYNKLQLNHGNNDDLFEYMDESDGTRRLFDLIPLLYTNKKRSVIFIDEIDRSLHTNLTKKFMQLFYNLTKNTSSQLIVTTHDSNLLDLDLVRQDEIWFVERQQDHSSKIYSLNKFKERFDKKIDKEYLIGRYGAIPFFNESFLGIGENFDE